jgi:hypothetical protein
MMLRTVLLFTLLAFSSLLHSQDYEPDPGFGDKGIFILDSGFSYSLGYSVLALNNGSYITANIVQDTQTRQFSFSLIKFTENGSIDLSFGEKGFYHLPTERTEFPVEIALLPGDKIAFAANAGDNNIELTILNRQGDALVKKILKPFSNNYLIPVRIYVHKNHIFIAGIYNSKSLDNEQVFIIKTDLDGNTDDSFGQKGLFLSEDHLLINARFQDIAFQDDDIIVFSSQQADEIFSNLFLYRLDDKGSFDSYFSESGIRLIMIDIIPFIGMVHTDSKGDIYLALFGKPKIFKLNREGFYDISYAQPDPIISSKIPLSFYSSMRPDNSLMIFGTTNSGITGQFGKPAVTQIGIRGNTDTNFGKNGFYITEIENPSAYFNGCFDKSGNLITIGAWEETKGDLSSRTLLVRHRPKTTSVVDHDHRDEYVLFPNPVYDDHLFIDYQNPVFIPETIELIDVLGRKIAHYYTSALPDKGGNMRIEIPAGIKDGIYFLKIKNRGYETIKRFLVLRAYSY